VRGGTTMRLRDERGMMAIGVALMLIVVLALFGGA
jgi:Tfp pilus assembly protein PilX